MIKRFHTLGIEGQLRQPDKGRLWKIQLTSNGERLDAFCLRSGTRKGCCHPLNTVLEVPTRTIRQEKGIKGGHIGKEEVTLSLFANDTILYIENTKESTVIY